MVYSRILVVLIICFLAVSCGTAPQQSGAKFTLKKPTFTTADGSKFVTGTISAPDGEKARIIIPSGQGFASATLKSVDTDEPFKVLVNKWLNKLCKTNSIAYVDSELKVSPVLRDEGQFDMLPADISIVNEQLKTRGFNLKVFSSEEGLNCSK